MDSNIDIRICGDDLDFDELNLSAADQIQLLKENDSVLEFFKQETSHPFRV